MSRFGFALILVILASGPADARGLFRNRKPADADVPPTPGAPDPRQMVTPSGVPVPAWASRRIAKSPVPLYGPSWGRRPWAYPLSTQATPAAYWARLDQNGFGAGPIPDFTNGPSIGNVPSAPIGPDNGPIARQGYRPLFGFPNFPFGVYSQGK